MFAAFVVTVHVIVSVFLIFVILLQPGKEGGMAAFSGGGGGSQTAFGGRGSVTFLSKVTTACAIIFMLTSLTLAWRSSHSDSVLRARRNLAAQDAAAKKNDLAPKAPDTQNVPAKGSGGAAVPAQGSGAPAGDKNAPAAAPAKEPAAPAAPKK